LTCASETLRLELGPFGVKVVTAMVGSIDTRFHNNTPPSALPAHSLYRPIEQYIQNSAQGKNSPKGTDVNVFAEQLVKDVLRGKKGQIWRGNMASMTKWVSSWVPWGILDGMVAKGRGLDKLKEAAAPAGRGPRKPEGERPRPGV
jgi:1-acylglycerone phosphate reductase